MTSPHELLLASAGTGNRVGEGAPGAGGTLSPEVIDPRRSARTGSVPGQRVTW